MKTIADLKRRIVLGVKLDCYNHLFKRNLGIREIGLIQSNAFAFNTDRGTLSYCNFPKKNEIQFVDNNTFNIINPDNNELILTYTFV